MPKQGPNGVIISEVFMGGNGELVATAAEAVTIEVTERLADGSELRTYLTAEPSPASPSPLPSASPPA